MHESLKSSIIDASAGDLQIAVDEPGSFIYFQLRALFCCCATGMNIKRINETLIMMAINQKSVCGEGGAARGGAFSLNLIETLRRALTFSVCLD